jgi:dihydrofolate synthase/folylpolyglutamate synthase
VAVLAVSADKDVPGILEELEPAASSLVVTRNSASRSMDPGELEQLAAGVFGPDRVLAAPRLDEAIDTATALADEASGGLGGAGILITGSTTTAGEARVLFGAAGAVQPAGAGLDGEAPQ